jgi:hypothetical protein
MPIVYADEIMEKKGKNDRLFGRMILIGSILGMSVLGLIKARHSGLLGIIAFSFGWTLIPSLLAIAAYLIAKLTIKTPATSNIVYLFCYTAILYWFCSRILS